MRWTEACRRAAEEEFRGNPRQQGFPKGPRACGSTARAPGADCFPEGSPMPSGYSHRTNWIPFRKGSPHGSPSASHSLGVSLKATVPVEGIWRPPAATKIDRPWRCPDQRAYDMGMCTITTVSRARRQRVPRLKCQDDWPLGLHHACFLTARQIAGCVESSKGSPLAVSISAFHEKGMLICASAHPRKASVFRRRFVTAVSR